MGLQPLSGSGSAGAGWQCWLHLEGKASWHAAPTVASRLPVVALDSSDARMPKPLLLMYLAVPRSSSVKELLPMLSGRQAASVTHACPLKAVRRAWHPACSWRCAGSAPSEGARAVLRHKGRPANGRRQVPASAGPQQCICSTLVYQQVQQLSAFPRTYLYCFRHSRQLPSQRGAAFVPKSTGSTA